MKRLQSYFGYRPRFSKLWKDYIPVTNMSLLGIEVVVIGVIAALLLLPVREMELAEFRQKSQVEGEKPERGSWAATAPDGDLFAAIEDNNPFSPSRKDWKSDQAVTAAPPPPAKKVNKVVKKKRSKPRMKPGKIKLSAIVVFGSSRLAMIESFGKAKSRGKYIFVKVGEDVAGYTVKNIERDRLVLEWEGEESVVKMHKF